MAGAEVRPARTALEPLGEQDLDLLEAQLGVRAASPRLSPRRPPRRGRAASSARCQGSHGRVDVSASATSPSARQPGGDRLRVAQPIDGGAEAIDELGQSAGEADRSARHVVEREDVGEQALPVLAHRRADQDPVEAGAPRSLRDRVELERRPVPGVEPPVHAARRHPGLELGEVVVVEAEPPAHRLGVGEVEHLRGGQPPRRQLEDPRDHPEHGIALPQRPVREPDPKPWRDAGVVARHLLGRQRLYGAERGLDQRGERLDVGAHDDDVARLDRRVVLERVQD